MPDDPPSASPEWINPYQLTKRGADTLNRIDENLVFTRLTAGTEAGSVPVREWKFLGGDWGGAGRDWAARFLDAGLVTAEPAELDTWSPVSLTTAGDALFTTWRDHPFLVIDPPLAPHVVLRGISAEFPFTDHIERFVRIAAEATHGDRANLDDDDIRLAARAYEVLQEHRDHPASDTGSDTGEQGEPVMTRGIYHYGDGVTPPLDLDQVERRLVQRSSTENATYQARVDAWMVGHHPAIGTDDGGLVWESAGTSEPGDQYADSARHTAQDATRVYYSLWPAFAAPSGDGERWRLELIQVRGENEIDRTDLGLHADEHEAKRYAASFERHAPTPQQTTQT